MILMTLLTDDSLSIKWYTLAGIGAAEGIIGNGILGLGYGMYLSVDTALIARILPEKEDAAKDYGLMNIATGRMHYLPYLLHC